MPRIVFPVAVLGILMSCGGGESELQRSEVRFSAHPLACDVPGMEAWLRVTGVDGVCPLTVAADRTVSGSCAGVPGRAERVFRIEYFVVLMGRRVQLASANLVVDLTEETREIVPIDFSRAQVVTELDLDGDGATNLFEFCTGRDPTDPNR